MVTEGLLVQRQGSGTYIVPITAVSAVQVLLAGDIKQSDPFYNKFLTGVTHFCTDNSIQLQVTREGTLNGLKDDHAPLIIVGLIEEETIQWVRKTKGLIVSTQYYPDFLDITQLLFDDRRIGWEAAQVLFQYGHSHVIHLSGPSAYPSADERTKGFLDGAAKRHMDVITLQGKMNWRSGHDLGEQVAKLVKTARPATAVFASND